MFLREFLLFSIAFLMTGCSNSKKLILSFTMKEGSYFEEGMQIELKKEKIGYVSDIKSYKGTILLKAHFDKRVKIPEGSQFILHEPLIGHEVIELVLSNNKTFLSSKDTVQGIYKSANSTQ